MLAPIAPDWDNLDLMRRNKWRAIARRYPELQPPEQERIRDRMQGWSKLSSQERQAARERFKGINQLPIDQRRELSNKWMEYQSLPQEQRQALRQAPPGARRPFTNDRQGGRPAGQGSPPPPGGR